DWFECPQAGFQVKSSRDIDTGGDQTGLIRANLRPIKDQVGNDIGPLRPGYGRVYQFAVDGPLIGRNGGQLPVYFPVADGHPDIDAFQATAFRCAETREATVACTDLSFS